jgi:hypothetical protein
MLSHIGLVLLSLYQLKTRLTRKRVSDPPSYAQRISYQFGGKDIPYGGNILVLISSYN